MGCSDSVNESTGIGCLMLNTEISPELKLSRAIIEGQEAERLSDDCLVWISNSKGLVREYKGIKSVPADGIWLTGGQYVAEAWAGDSVPASFTDRYFKGSKNFTIASGSADKVDLVCKIANVGVSVKYNVPDGVLQDYDLTVSHSAGSLTWEGDDNRRGYFMMNSRDKELKYTITGVDEKGEDFTRNGVIKDVKGGVEYTLVINHNTIELEQGGLAFKIEIEESPMAIDKVITINSAPLVLGREDDLDNVQSGEPGAMYDMGMYVVATQDLASVVVNFSGLETILGMDYPEIDILALHKDENKTPETEALHERFEEAGFEHVYVDPVGEESGEDVLLIFKKRLLDKLSAGYYEFSVTATDIDGKVGTGSLKVMITDAVSQVVPLPENSPAVWATQVTLTGNILKDTETAGFKYRQKGTENWNYVEGKATSRAFTKGTKYSAVVTGLTPNTPYEYKAVAGEFESAEINEFTTEDTPQLPNAGFEDWFIESGSRKPYYIAKSNDGSSLFWDSGNHGSATMNKNVTTPETGIKHSGEYSIKLESQFVGLGTIGAFAAGNVFVGSFLGTEKTTKGILGWGRPWNSRPKVLKGYVKYTPQAVNYSDIDAKKVGDMDEGIVYIALVDDTKMSYTDADKHVHSGWPQIVATNNINQYGFKPTDAKVIGYGEKVWTSATPEEGLMEFEITLEYYRTDVKPSNIIIVASASRYGDYYTGGPSVMYLDDLELVY